MMICKCRNRWLMGPNETFIDDFGMIHTANHCDWNVNIEQENNMEEVVDKTIPTYKDIVNNVGRFVYNEYNGEFILIVQAIDDVYFVGKANMAGSPIILSLNNVRLFDEA